MSVINRLATTLGRRDDVPNRELARELAETKAVEDIRELVANLQNRDRKIQSDCIKVLYEVGYIAPELIAEYAEDFLALLRSRNNRLVWGGMSALAAIAKLSASTLFDHWEEIREAIEKGSVITVDRGIKALSIVAAQRTEYGAVIFPYLLTHLGRCRPKDVSRDAEAILVAVNSGNKKEFVAVINARMGDMRPAQVKRLKKVLAVAEKR
ncbi:MAG: hypothetical protein DRN07_03740 [Thermoplasmata archaeon]|nr:MAG: hypothetical protein DRN07_03740 [Thermoplasmata archaeon]